MWAHHDPGQEPALRRPLSSVVVVVGARPSSSSPASPPPSSAVVRRRRGCDDVGGGTRVAQRTGEAMRGDRADRGGRDG
jgi:hypothetical protein